MPVVLSRPSLALAVILALTGPPHSLADAGWRWPVDTVQLLRPYEAPAHLYGPGHRGIDLAVDDLVRAPADGRIAFAGSVAGRSVVTIDHGNGLVSTLEPLATELSSGDVVARGAVVGHVSPEGHTGAHSLHFGVRLDGEYINPLRLLGGVPRAVLLPCC
ncbi:murein hydrolase activator EnvC family protein [Microbacterium trichothecenolyticum]|uniref:Murein DD-endopeptidase MepM/ murein hydrolase activator NlpD n=1 Tax=Microbacterium trichothecenolyticum TaxID=69370 RepID=A0ABU0TQM5_MICTR|nr:M23 family metallopeptidase [Microbacterium trichothecenolyticum]MDQ1121960.1 murein DD-endopeptidase MepM/ murein hydrolase activator NlpD [Microbacterium trichothecenolyticum]